MEQCRARLLDFSVPLDVPLLDQVSSSTSCQPCRVGVGYDTGANGNVSGLVDPFIVWRAVHFFAVFRCTCEDCVKPPPSGSQLHPLMMLQVVECSQNPGDPNRKDAHQLLMELQVNSAMWYVAARRSVPPAPQGVRL